MGDRGGKRKLDDDDPEAEAWPPATEKKMEKEERWGKAGAVLIVSLVTLPFLVFFLGGGRAGATSAVWQNAAKLISLNNGGLLNSSLPSATGATSVDELFGGLLAPGFDRAACLSRHESLHYYKPSPYAPSSHLVQKLRDYEARHMRCAPGTSLYTKSVEQLKSGKSIAAAAAAATECSYVVWIPYNGLGNRMLTLLSAFLYALLTNRVLLVDSPDDFTDLFCEPFPGTTWALPSDFPVTSLTRLGVNSGESYGNLLGNKKISNDPTNTTAQAAALPPYVYLHLAHDHRYHDGLFYCNDDQLVLARVQWLLLQSDLYFVPQLYSIPGFHEELHRLFPLKESIAYLLSHYMFHPTNTVWGLVTRYYHSYLAQVEEKISVQVRMFPWASIPIDDMYKQILACSRQEHILPGTDGDEVNSNTTTNDAAAASTAILVTSLQADYYERIKSTYYEHAAKGGGQVGVFQPSHEERQDTGRRWHNQKALAEIYLLSFSDELLTTGASTFGYMAAVLGGLRQTILLNARDHKVPETPCVRAISMEPCFQTLPRVKCSGKAVEKEELSRHVKACEDLSDGIKLFD